METEEYTYFPPKPEIKDKNTSSILKTIGSLALFVGLFALLGISLNLIFLVVLVLFLHEMGHLIAMKSYGYQDVGMFFIPFLGAVVTGRKEEMSQFQRLIIVLAGPIPGILIGAGFLLGYHFGDLHQMFLIYGLVFVALNVLNLIPVDPLDGGKLFELLFFSFSDFAKVLFNGISSAVMILIGFLYQSYVIMIFGGFMLFRIQSHVKLMRLRKRLNHLEIPLNVSYAKLSDKDYWRLRKEYLQIANLDRLISPDSKDYDEKEEVVAPAIRNILRAPVDNDVNMLGKLSFVFIWAAAIVLSLYSIWINLNDLKELL
ncbi:site-2 protease family protein [Parvicella tangerina]|uniref:Peptidase M50 domain-containing protein n=1 Tax=Parvicella tangerina TaxID=2829795 RepID=A0A916N9B7_9FLAO|nr:site-2 protease family protein [Parvicella tangerina]CAG5076833.1 hypothetical protein CRYO30217_00215 [Parvicella tangerina]